MYKKLLLFSAFIASTASLTAQSSKDFRTYGNAEYESSGGIVSDSLGNNVIFGVFQGTLNAGNNIVLQSQKGAGDFFLIKRDSTGQTIWAKSFGANDTIVNHAWYKDEAADLCLDKAGNIYLLGHVNCSADIVFGSITIPDAQTPTAKNTFVSQFDKNGNCNWVKINTTNANTGPRKISVDGKKRTSITGGAYGGEVFGTYTLSSSGTYIAMFDSLGTALWAKSYSANVYALASDKHGYVYCAASTSASQFGGTSITLKGNTDLVVARIDSTGTVAWVRNEGSPGNTLGGFAIERHNNDLYVLANHTGSLSMGATALPGSNRFFVTAYDLQGSSLWSRETDVASSWANPALCDLAVNKQNELFVLMNSSSTFLFGTSSINLGGVGAIVLKYNGGGSPDWALSYASSVNYGMNTSKMSCDDYKHLFLSGNFAGSLAIAGSPSLNAFGNGNYDIFASILKAQNTTVGFGELSADKSFYLFPNPASDVVQLGSTAGSLDHSYTITNQLGQTVAQGVLSSSSATNAIPVAELGNGFYFINLSGPGSGNIVASKKFLIMR